MIKKKNIKEKLKKQDNLTPFIFSYSFFKNKYKNRVFNSNLNVSVIMVGSSDLKSINSVLNQSFKDFELIIVDKSHMNFDSNKIKYYQLNYENFSQARNYAIQKASNNIIAYLDEGNYWNKDFLKDLTDSLKNFDCVYCNSLNQDNNILYDGFINLNSFIHKKDLINKYGNFNEELGNLSEWDFINRIKKSKTNYLKKSLVENNTKLNFTDEEIYTIHERHWTDLYGDDYQLIKDCFDEEYYVYQYGDEIPKNLHPIHHFLCLGYKEGKNPNSEFVTTYYKNKYKIKSNPLIHYFRNPKNKINYFDEKNSIIATNSFYLSNYNFDQEPLVSIIILNKDGVDHLKRLFDDFESKTNYNNYEIIVVDNASVDSSIDYLKSLNLNLKIIENEENVSFAKGNNDAVKIAKGEYVLLLNNDIEPTYGWLNEMMGTIIYNKNVASVGAKLLYPYIDDPKNTNKSFTIQHSGDILRQAIDDVCLYKGHNQNKFSKDIFNSSISVNKKRLLVTGAVLLIKKSVYDELNGLDESYWYGYEDIDFNLRVHNAGYDTIFSSSALLFHHESATRKTINRNNHKVFCKKWSKYLFRKLLQDKIEKNFFFTDEKLNILLVVDPDSSRRYSKCINNLMKYFVSNEYIVNISFNDYSKVNYKTDILISFSQDFNIKNVHSRDNLIKILINDDIEDCIDYNIILQEDLNLGSKIISKLYELI